MHRYALGLDHNWPSALAQLTFTINLLDWGTEDGLVMEPGVYWFCGAILQFYLLFLAFKRLSDRWLWALVAGALAVNYLAFYLLTADASWWVRQNAIGWVSPFVLGMLAGRSPRPLPRRWCAVALLPALAALAACLTLKPLAPLTEVCTIVLFVSLTALLPLRPMAAIGTVSASLFIIHPLVRAVSYSMLAHTTWSTGAMVAVYLAAVAALGWLHHVALNRYSGTSLGSHFRK